MPCLTLQTEPDSESEEGGEMEREREGETEKVGERAQESDSERSIKRRE